MGPVIMDIHVYIHVNTDIYDNLFLVINGQEESALIFSPFFCKYALIPSQGRPST